MLIKEYPNQHDGYTTKVTIMQGIEAVSSCTNESWQECIFCNYRNKCQHNKYNQLEIYQASRIIASEEGSGV